MGNAEARDEGIILDGSLKDYIGSGACAVCHASLHEKWSKRLKAGFVRYRKDYPGTLPGNWDTIPSEWGDGSVSEENVLIIVGKKRKFAFVDKSWRVIPYEYQIKKKNLE